MQEPIFLNVTSAAASCAGCIGCTGCAACGACVACGPVVYLAAGYVILGATAVGFVGFTFVG